MSWWTEKSTAMIHLPNWVWTVIVVICVEQLATDLIRWIW